MQSASQSSVSLEDPGGWDATDECRATRRLCDALRLLIPETLMGDERVLKNAKRMQEAPMHSTLRVNTITATPREALEEVRRLLSEQDPGFEAAAMEELPYVIKVSPIGPNLVVPAVRRATVPIDCAVSVMRGAHVYAAGILAVEDDPDEAELVSVWVDLKGRCTRGLRVRYTGETRFIGNGRLMVTREALFGPTPIVAGLGVQMTEMPWRMPSLHALPSHSFLPQNLPSILAVEALDLAPGLTVLDMCASPGGKTSHIATLMGNNGLVVAIDKNKGKISRLNATLQDLRVTCAKSFVADSSRLILLSANGTLSPNEQYECAHLVKPGSFDRVLLDPPCSGFGQRPAIVPEDATLFDRHLDSFSSYQKKLFSVAVALLKPGGILVYSTCTISPAENEGVVAHALKSHPVKLEPSDASFGSDGLLTHGLSEGDCVHVRRFWPAGRDDTIAFFFARFRKT